VIGMIGKVGAAGIAESGAEMVAEEKSGEGQVEAETACWRVAKAERPVEMMKEYPHEDLEPSSWDSVQDLRASVAMEQVARPSQREPLVKEA